MRNLSINSQNCFLLSVFLISSSIVYHPIYRSSKLIGWTSELKTGTVPFSIAPCMSIIPAMLEYGLMSTFGSRIDAINRPVLGSLIRTILVRLPISALSCTLKYSTNCPSLLSISMPSSLLISSIPTSKLRPLAAFKAP